MKITNCFEKLTKHTSWGYLTGDSDRIFTVTEVHDTPNHDQISENDVATEFYKLFSTFFPSCMYYHFLMTNLLEKENWLTVNNTIKAHMVLNSGQWTNFSSHHQNFNR